MTSPPRISRTDMMSPGRANWSRRALAGYGNVAEPEYDAIVVVVTVETAVVSGDVNVGNNIFGGAKVCSINSLLTVGKVTRDNLLPRSVWLGKVAMRSTLLRLADTRILSISWL